MVGDLGGGGAGLTPMLSLLEPRALLEVRAHVRGGLQKGPREAGRPRTFPFSRGTASDSSAHPIPHPKDARGSLLEIPFPLLSCSLSVIALRVRYALVQMQEGVRAAGEQRVLLPGRTGGLAAIAAVTALRFLVGVGRSCLPRRGCVGARSSLLALRARCLWTPSPAHD